MGDAYRADLLRQRYEQLRDEAQQKERNGDRESAVRLYTEAIAILEKLRATDYAGEAEAKIQQRLKRHVHELQGVEQMESEELKVESAAEKLEDNHDSTFSSTSSGSEDGSSVKWDGFETKQPDIDFDDVGGREKLIQEIKHQFIGPIRDKDRYDYYGLDTPNGLLLYGPPGTGKSYLAEAIGGELDATFVHIRSGDIKSKWKGESDSNVDKLFEKARQDQPCILFFDEADALFTDRDEWHTDGDIVNNFLRQISELKGEDVFIIAATNNPKRLDNAILRDGRMDKRVKIGLPNNRTRLEMLKVLAENHPLEEGKVDLRSISDDTQGYSAADLEALLKDAARKAMREGVDINQKHLRNAVRNSTPSVHRSE